MKQFAHPPILERGEEYYEDLFEKTKQYPLEEGPLKFFLTSLAIAVVVLVIIAYVLMVSFGGRVRLSPDEKEVQQQRIISYFIAERLLSFGGSFVVDEIIFLNSIYERNSNIP